jgi:hypothetical protein
MVSEINFKTKDFVSECGALLLRGTAKDVEAKINKAKQTMEVFVNTVDSFQSV